MDAVFNYQMFLKQLSIQKIVDKIDKDNDGKVSSQELQDWIKFSRMQNHLETVTNRWEDLKQREKRLVSWGDYKGDKNVNPNSPVSWETYKRISFGANPEKHEDSERLLKQMKVDERRWKGADLDYDNKLTKEEFGAFYHPWEYDHMHGVAAQDNLDDMDKDKDGRVSLQEYLDDLYRKSENELTKEQLKQREADIKYFHSHRDANKDGYLDTDEVKEWVFPTSYSHLEAEASHLIHHADADKDKQLTKEEILAKHDLFVGSRATNYGKDLEKHDEF